MQHHLKQHILCQDDWVSLSVERSMVDLLTTFSALKGFQTHYYLRFRLINDCTFCCHGRKRGPKQDVGGGKGGSTLTWSNKDYLKHSRGVARFLVHHCCHQHLWYWNSQVHHNHDNPKVDLTLILGNNTISLTPSYPFPHHPLSIIPPVGDKSSFARTPGPQEKGQSSLKSSSLPSPGPSS